MPWFIITPSSNDLMHHGIKGQRWGIRRYQNKDGSLTSEGRSRNKKRDLSDEEQSFLNEKKSYYKISDPESEKDTFDAIDSYVRKYGINPSEKVRENTIKKNNRLIKENLDSEERIRSELSSTLSRGERRRILDVMYGYKNAIKKPGDDKIINKFNKANEHRRTANYYYNENEYLKDPKKFIYSNRY